MRLRCRAAAPSRAALPRNECMPAVAPIRRCRRGYGARGSRLRRPLSGVYLDISTFPRCDIVVERSERPAQNIQPRYRAVRGALLSSWTRGLTAAPSALAVALPPDTAKPALAVYIASWKVLPLGAVASANTG